MKTTLQFIRILVGLLFIFSGLVKANDPMGTAYKMEEYFEVWNTDLSTSSFFFKSFVTGIIHFLNNYTLVLSVLMNAFEILAGAALLLGWRMKFFGWLLLLLMIFFTLLTAYTYKTGRPTNCGCFGDCIKITPEYSFYKDILLSVLIVFLLFGRKHIKPWFSGRWGTVLMIGVGVLSFGLQGYALKYLPPVDCLPFKKGNNLVEKMKIPAHAVSDSIVMTFVYEKKGERVEFTADQFPADFNDSIYHFINRYDKLIRKGKNNEPPIKGFSLSGITNTDSTLYILELPKALLLFEEKPVFGNWEKHFKEIERAARQKNIPLFIVTASLDEYLKSKTTTLPVLKCDFTAIRTAARACPTLYYLNSGTVREKWSYADFVNVATALADF